MADIASDTTYLFRVAATDQPWSFPVPPNCLAYARSPEESSFTAFTSVLPVEVKLGYRDPGQHRPCRR